MEHLSHLPLSDLVLEEGSWGPIWLVGRGGIPLLWGPNAKYILKQVLSPISRYNCSQRFCADPWPHGNVMGALCHAQQRVTYGHCHCGAHNGFILLFVQVNHRH